MARINGMWFADVNFQDSILVQQFFGWLLLANMRLCGLVKAAQFAKGLCRVRWRSDTIPVLGSRLPKAYIGLAQRLDILCPAGSGVEWHAVDSTYILQGSNERHHLCWGTQSESCGGPSCVVCTAYFRAF